MTASDNDYFAGNEYRRALMTKLTRRIFGTEKAGAVNIFGGRYSDHTAPSSDAQTVHVVAQEGTNPAPGSHFTQRDNLRQMTREIFNPVLAGTDPVTFNVIP